MNVHPGVWNRRIARSRELIDRFPAASEILRFYAELAAYQRSVGELDAVSSSEPDTFANAIDRTRVRAAFAGFLEWLARAAPAAVVEQTAGLRDIEADEWQQRLESYLGGARDHEDPHDAQVAFVIEAVLQPFAERAAVLVSAQPRLDTGGGAIGSPVRVRSVASTGASGDTVDPSTRLERAPGGVSQHEPSVGRRRCPVCGDRPVLGVLREEGQGARRSLVCALCSTEWPSRRVYCVACSEERFDALPVYTPEQCPHVRIDACDTCRTYLKIIDLSKDGLAVPQVDDLATLSLDLWAREQGYTRLRANLLRM
jgi:FdhE protein